MISNCSHDENWRYKDGKAGDQGGEWVIRSWYNRPWNVVLRYPDPQVGKAIAKDARAAAENDNIGYDQNDRYTFWTQLKANNYDPSKITTKCQADCSSGVAAITKAVGYKMGLSALQSVSIYAYTGDLRERLVAAGFKALTDSKYLTSDEYLLPGDVLLYEGHHTCINLDTGSKANYKPTIYKGYKDSIQGGNWCATMQTGLNKIMNAGLEIDGSCGSKSDAAIRNFQSAYNLEVDGHFGPKSWAKLESLLEQQAKQPAVKKVQITAIAAGSYIYTTEKDGYGYIPNLDIWVKI